MMTNRWKRFTNGRLLGSIMATIISVQPNENRIRARVGEVPFSPILAWLRYSENGEAPQTARAAHADTTSAPTESRYQRWSRGMRSAAITTSRLEPEVAQDRVPPGVIPDEVVLRNVRAVRIRLPRIGGRAGDRCEDRVDELRRPTRSVRERVHLRDERVAE